MLWIFYSLIYGVMNALYLSFNEKHHYNGYVLGIWRGFGISLLVSPLLLTVPVPTSFSYYLILIMQGVMIGIYDSHIFFASAKYGSRSSMGFMATTVLITAFIWWSIDFNELVQLLAKPAKLITIFLTLVGFSISYWQMMKVHIKPEAERYLYPASLALALMSIATRYIAINGGSAYNGVIYYLFVSCLVSGVYNTCWFMIKPLSDTSLAKNKQLIAPFKNYRGLWLIFFSVILITAKTLALRIADNPAYVIAVLLLSPIFLGIIDKKPIKITIPLVFVIFFLVIMLLMVV